MNNSQSFLDSKYLNPDYLFNQAVTFFQHLSESGSQYHAGSNALSLFHTILFLLSFFFITLISYCAVRMFEIRKKEHAHLHHEIEEYAMHQRERERKIHDREEISKNPRWIKVLDYLFSEHDSDWKLAIIEADSMLEALMDQLGFKGDTLGDKLKSASLPPRLGTESFRGLSSAWEVHTIRNRIAHEGADFIVTQREAKRVIAIYEQIFREFGFI